MRYADPPMSVRSLEQHIRNLEGDDGLAQRRRVGMALVVVAEMFPGGVVKVAARWRCTAGAGRALFSTSRSRAFGPIAPSVIDTMR